MSTQADGLCRLCLRDIGHYGTRISIFKISQQGDLAAKISSCLPVSLDMHDSLPKFICRPCHTKVDYVYNFRSVCAKSESELKQMLQVSNLEQKENNSCNLKPLDFAGSGLLGDNVLVEMDVDKTNSFSEDIPIYILENLPTLSESTAEMPPELIFLPSFHCEPGQVLVDNLESSKTFPIGNPTESNPLLLTNLQCEEIPNNLIPNFNQDSLVNFYMCSVCKQQFGSSDDLVFHLDQSHGETPSQSSSPRKVTDFHSNISLELPHLEQASDSLARAETEGGVAKSQLKFQEIQNSSSFNINNVPEARVLNVSVKNHNSKKCYFCVCGKEFENFEILENHAIKCHLIMQTTNNDNYQTCQACKNKFYSKQELEMHLSKSLENLKCTYCAFRCGNNETLNTHKWHCYKRNWPFECPTCQEKLLTSVELQAHKAEMHSFVCDICKGQFKENCHLEEHRNIHFRSATNSKIKPSNNSKEVVDNNNFVCDCCQMNFDSKQSIEYHMLVHLAAREKLSVMVRQIDGRL